jgi:nitrogen regulatory protein P-II 1
MKRIEATVAPFQIDAISDALDREGIYDITLSEVRTAPLRRGQVARYRGAEYLLKFVPGMKIEVLLDDFEVPKVVALIRMLARTDGACDGRIFVIPVADAIRIRTGEHASAASFGARI